MSKAKEFFEKLVSGPKAQELFQNKGKPETPEKMIKAYAGAANQLGYELTAKDIAEYINEKEKAVKSGTESAAKAIEKLSDDKLEKVSGGGEHPNCKDTFQNKENCWFNDGCDIVNNHYNDYKCKSPAKDEECGENHAMLCTGYYRLQD